MIKYFTLPGYYRHFLECMMIMKYREKHPEYFFEDRIIESFYDCPPGILWNGGRDVPNFHNVPFTEVMQYYKDKNISLRHTFTNSQLTPELITDYMANKFVKEQIKENDKVILNHPDLIKHFQLKYPNIDIVYSTTLNILDIDQINEITKNHIYVLNYNMNNNNDYLKKLKYLNNIEILCAEPCAPNCEKRIQHYDYISKNILDMIPADSQPWECPYKSQNKILCKIQELPHAINDERIEQLSQMGIQYFKISGRNIKITAWIETMVLFLIKPEYREFVRQDIFQRFSNCR